MLLPLWVGWAIGESTGFVVATTQSSIGSVFSKRKAVTKPFEAAPIPRAAKYEQLGSGSDDEFGTGVGDGPSDGEHPNNEKGGGGSLQRRQQQEQEPKIDHGGSNTTDRFKYKVHALMGTYDPAGDAADDDQQDGNIMKALVTFPTRHVFDAVGRVAAAADANDDANDGYAESVRSVVFGTTGDEDVVCEVFPRGKKFVKVRCTATVQSTTMINAIYDELGRMESTVMKF